MQIFAPRPSGASKKTSERSEVIVAFAFYIILEGICKKLPLRIERKRDSIEFERVKQSENQQKKTNQPIADKRDPNTLDLFSKMTDAQRHMFANKLSELPEMGKYSQGTESYQQFAVRIAEMLQDPERIIELYPHLKKVGYMPSNKRDTVNG